MCEKPYTRAELEQLIKDLLDITEVPFQIKRQIRDYIERGFTYKGIARALCFLVDNRKFNLRDSYQQYGIGIVKNVYGEAQAYFEKLRQMQEEQLAKQQQILQSINTNTRIFIKCGQADQHKKINKKQINVSEL